MLAHLKIRSQKTRNWHHVCAMLGVEACACLWEISLWQFFAIFEDVPTNRFLCADTFCTFLWWIVLNCADAQPYLSFRQARHLKGSVFTFFWTCQSFKYAWLTIASTSDAKINTSRWCFVLQFLKKKFPANLKYASLKLAALSDPKINALRWCFFHLHFFKKNCHCPERFQATFERIWYSLDTAVGGSWCVGHHLALAGYVVVLAGQRRVVGH